MRYVQVDNYILNKPVIEILYQLKSQLTNGKLRDIFPKVSDIVVTCPVHSNGMESHPDCNIYIGDDDKIPYGYARCFACDFKGPFYVFVAECMDTSVDYAKKWLINNFGELAFEKLKIDNDIVIGKKQIIKTLDSSELNLYQSYCPYLQKRGISRNTAEQFNVKYDPKFRQVIFPVYDDKNNLVMLAKRSIDTKTFYMTANVEKEPYCLNYIINNNIKKVLITEGPFDTLSGWEHSVPTIGTLGTISDYQVDKINNSGIKFLYLAFDNDASGRRFNEYIKNRLSDKIITTDIELPISKKDLNELSDENWKNLKEKYNF